MALSFVIAAEAASSHEAVGYVFDSIGDWLQDGVRFPHKNGDPVYAGATVTLDPAYKDPQRQGAAIIINLFNGKREERSLNQPTTFSKPIQLPTSLGNESSTFGRLLRAMGALFAREPDKYLITTVRGVDELRLHEAVVELRNGEVDVAPAFATAPPGKYALRFSPIGQRETNVNVSDQSVTFHCQPGERVAVPKLSSGLWRLEILRRNGERLFETDAWLLVLQSPNYQRAIRLFDDAAAVTRKWGNAASDSEVRTFVRTALDALGHAQIE